MKINFNERLKNRVKKKRSQLCIGLDPEIEKLPPHLQDLPEPLFTFCKEIIDYTHKYAVSYKPNIAFFERLGSKGIYQFEKTIAYIQNSSPDVLIVGDVKRGDLANTSKEYAKYYFNTLKLDSITISPYMGKDSFIPYLESGGHIFLLCLTSNPSSKDYQYRLTGDETLYEYIASDLQKFSKEYIGQIGIVVGATHAEELKKLRTIAPDLALLIPGYGAQGAKLDDIMPICGELSLVNSSRSIIFASQERNFGSKAEEIALQITKEMQTFF